MPPPEFDRPHLPPWLIPLSSLGTILRLVRKADLYELQIALSMGGTIGLSVPDSSEAAGQVARALSEAGRILERNPAKLRAQTGLFEDKPDG